MSFIDELQKQNNRGLTENNAATNLSTLDPLLDFFASAGAMRNNLDDAALLFGKAYGTDKQTALRTLFYLRDIRGGQGERTLFRVLLKILNEEDPAVFAQVASFVPTYGRWDDLFDIEINEQIANIVAKQLELDEANMEAGKPVSLLAKWMPSDNATSKLTREKARKLAHLLKLTSDPITLDNGHVIPNLSPYRRKLSKLRKYIRLLEQQMSAKQWGEVNYSKLPSQAHRKHVKAFHRHDEERYSKFLEKATKGEAKLNTATLYTYEVFDAVSADPQAADAMWANLPDWTNGHNAIVLADVSGSMTGRPISVSVSLALYFAEHNQGTFHNCFMTFSESPQVVQVHGTTLAQKLGHISSRAWHMNTNLQKALLAILEVSRNAPEDAPEILYIISDMEFDEACGAPNATLLEDAQKKYDEANIRMPHVVFWNVNARNTNVPATKFDNRVTLVSGLSQSTFRYVVEGKSPTELMLEVINSDRYAPIVVK